MQPVDSYFTVTLYVHFKPVRLWVLWTIYRVRVKSFPDYKHLLQENYVEYKHIFCVEVY